MKRRNLLFSPRLPSPQVAAGPFAREVHRP